MDNETAQVCYDTRVGLQGYEEKKNPVWGLKKQDVTLLALMKKERGRSQRV